MAINTIQALANMKVRRGLGWEDWRSRSPKALGDMSGILLGRIGAESGAGVQDFDTDLIDKIYVCHDMVWTCIELISSTAAMGKMKVRKKQGDKYVYLPDHPLQKLLDYPNPSMTQFDLIQAYACHQRLYGTIGILLLRTEMVGVCDICGSESVCEHTLYRNTEGPVMQMMHVHPSTISEEVVDLNKDGKKKKMLCYCPSPGVKLPIHPNNILTDPFYNPSVGWYGVSPTFLLKRWLDLDTTMTAQVKALFDNGSIPSMIVSMKPGQNYVHEQEPATIMEMMKEKWMAQFSANGKGVKTPAFVYGDITVDRIQDKIEESLSKGLYFEIQGRVCATLGVPATLYEMGMMHGSQRASAEQGEKDFYNRTISKILKRLALKINALVVPSFGEEGLEVTWDLSEMGIASFLLTESQAAIKKDWELGLITRDEARLELGRSAIGGELGDDLYRISVMSDGSNDKQAAGMDNRLTIDKGSTDVTNARSLKK